ncbi:hypothetical protein SLEP1_g46554 [Rubroshorea leprosula]|uniref:Uncharacterized protein n=1 Tax=Rubroshorea leprosula TaxID=152421 RepID=A0AAV5LMP3_9ROSI|nr:hypothetical protein SLEP1_g46554 [Rubroshorea leprosula]
MHCDKCRPKAMKIAAVADDRFTDHDLSLRNLCVTSVAFHGEDRDSLLIERDGVDAACLTISLRKKFCHATLATVEEIKPKEENKDGDENMRTSIEMRDEPQGILTTFTSIDLSNNKFGGEIPELIGKLSYLKGHNLSHNKLTSPISPSLGNLKILEWLDLSSNTLVGKIPDEWVSLTQLSLLNLSNNHLVGCIPEGNHFSTFGNDSYEGNLGLSGIPLSKSCDGIGTPQSSFQDKDELCRFGWRVVVLGYGYGIVFGLLMGYHVFRTGKPNWFVSLFHGRPSQSDRKMRKARGLVQRRK